jgi:GNAT superfamily N-acetyltransferase
MHVRPGSREDAGDIAALLAQLGYPAGAQQVERRVARLLDAGAGLFLAEASAGVAGLAVLHVSPTLEYDGPAGKLGALVVDEAHRRRGVGAALVAAVEREARSRGCVLLFLTTAERRADAHAFYAALGFEETGRRFAKFL